MREIDLYPAVHDFLELRFRERLKPTYGELRSVSAITATAGGPQSGHWSRPDLALVALWRTKYGLRWSLDIHGFEVKTQTNCTPAAVHEALSHATLVHFAHLVWHKPDWSLDDRDCKAVWDRCERYGVGLIVFGDPSNADTFNIVLSARRHEPSIEAVDEFIETRFPDNSRQTLMTWIEGVR